MTCTVPFARKGPSLYLIFCCHHLEILNFIFEFVFCKSGPMGQWYMHLSGGDSSSMCNLPFLMPHSHKTFAMPQKHRIAVDLQCMRLQQDSKQDKHIIPISRGHTFYSNKNLLCMQKQGNDVLRSKNEQGILSFFLLSPCICQFSSQLVLVLNRC